MLRGAPHKGEEDESVCGPGILCFLLGSSRRRVGATVVVVVVQWWLALFVVMLVPSGGVPCRECSAPSAISQLVRCVDHEDQLEREDGQ